MFTLAPDTKTATFITLADQVHDGFYTYDNTFFDGYDKPVVVTCPIHGDFAINARDHMKGNGCLDCFVDSFNNTKRLDPDKKTHNQTVDPYKLKRGVVYLMLTNTGLVKIGVTQVTPTCNPQTRLRHLKKDIKKACPDRADLKGLKIVKVFRSKSGKLSEAYAAEASAHNFFSPHNVKLPKFNGYTEFFSVSIAEASHYLQSIGFEPVEMTV